jgi:NADH dehydrogenase FAD-containing subunit
MSSAHETVNMSSAHEIVLLGCHHAGIGIAHYLLRHVIPRLSELTPSTKYHLSVVCPHTEFFWNPAAPRHIIDGKLIPSSAIYFPIAEAFKDYQSDQFEFIFGKATALNPDAKTLTIDGGRLITYSALVVATGTSSNSILWQINSKQEDNKAEFEKYIEALPLAKTILILGGGPVGVETSGEIATHYPNAKTTLLSGGSRVLTRLPIRCSESAESQLKRKNVEVIHNVRGVPQPKNDDGTTSLKLSDGTFRTVDVFIDATGNKPNSSFLPASWLNSGGYILVDEKTLRCTAPGASDVYALGDMASYSDGSILAAIMSVVPVGRSIGIDIAAKAGKKFPLAQKEYSAIKDSQFVPVGPSGGVGQVYGWRLPSFLVWLIKSRNFFLWMAEGAVKGNSYMKP